MAARRSASLASRNSSIPEGTRNALQPRAPAGGEPPTSPRFPGTDASPETDVDLKLSDGGANFLLQRGSGRGDREVSERHVDQCGDAPGSRRPGRGGESLPVDAPRRVEVNVAVDQPGRDHPGAEILDRHVRRHGRRCRPGDERADSPLLDEDCARANAPVRPDDPPAAEPPEAGVGGQLGEVRAGADGATHLDPCRWRTRVLHPRDAGATEARTQGAIAGAEGKLTS